MSLKNFFPEIISKHPQAEIPFKGVTSHLIQALEQQIIFMNFENDVEVPEHSHAAQWGIVLEGEIELTIEGQTQIFQKGDYYYIEKDQKHSAKVKKGYKDITLFDQKDRYKIKK
ncbi:MAG: cupin [Bacteroidetes bacterium GWA2_30_7]|nr:MAG: cupin [Bacteroidetes bacterium GWA2_30_7]